MKLYEYLMDSRLRERSLDAEGIRAFKSLKAYKYYADSLVRNVWAHHLEIEDKMLYKDTVSPP